MTEHVLLALLEYQPFRKVLVKFGTPVDLLEQELQSYLDTYVATKPALNGVAAAFRALEAKLLKVS